MYDQMGAGTRMRKLFQTMSSTDNIKEKKLHVDGNWSLYGTPETWTPSDMSSYFVHKCSGFEDSRMHHYWINYNHEEEDFFYDIFCEGCRTSAPDGLQALWRFHNDLHATLVFLEANV